MCRQEGRKISKLTPYSLHCFFHYETRLFADDGERKGRRPELSIDVLQSPHVGKGKEHLLGAKLAASGDTLQKIGFLFLLFSY